MLAISLTIACSRYIYNGVILHAHLGCVESHNQHNATGEVATVYKVLVWGAVRKNIISDRFSTKTGISAHI